MTNRHTLKTQTILATSVVVILALLTACQAPAGEGATIDTAASPVAAATTVIATVEVVAVGTTTASPTETARPAAIPAAAVAATLGNLSYTGLSSDGPIALIDGRAEIDDGSSARPFVRLLDSLIPLGDLDGDGTEDAVALLEDNSSGTGRFVYLAAVLDVLGDAVPTDALQLGDRISVRSLTIDGSEIVADLVAQGPGDPLCCASWNVRKVIELRKGQLTEVSSEDLSRVSAADLDGTHWQLVSLDGVEVTPVLSDTEITLSVAGDQLTGDAGCSSYKAAVTSLPDAPSGLAIGPVASTQMLCPEPIMKQETAYLTRLQEVNSWWYDAGYLALNYTLGEDSFGYLRYEPLTTLP